MAAESLRIYGESLTKVDRHEKAIETWWQASEYARPDDPQWLRLTVVKTLTARGEALEAQERYDEVIPTWKQIAKHVCVDDQATLRYYAIAALISLGTAHLRLKQYENWISYVSQFSEYVHMNDPADSLQRFSKLLATGGGFMNFLGYHDDSESNCRKATEIDPECGEAWRIMAEAILGRDDDTRLEEAEQYARRAAELIPQNPSAFHTVSDILARRGNCVEALQMLDQALLVGSHNQNWQRHGLHGISDQPYRNWLRSSGQADNGEPFHSG